MKKIPMRMCVICREKTEKRSLLRIVRSPQGELVFDAAGKKNGRGAYICSKPECLNLEKNRKKIVNALECEVTADQLSAITEEIKSYLLARN